MIESGSLLGFDDLLAVFKPWGRIRWPRAKRRRDGSRRRIAIDVKRMSCYEHSTVDGSGAAGRGIPGVRGDEAVATQGEVSPEHGLVEDFSQRAERLIGALEVLGAFGVILPALTGILPWLTPLAALGLVLTMVGAALTHLGRAEYGPIAVTAVLLVMEAFVAYGRFFVLPA
jgi:hypothetical protein